jgi:2-polyprenyl-3-methyl-5-hydroxy-6-metoxy-1,4-benzoquinol methylase
MTDERWNSNLHVFDQLLASIAPGAQRALDVGCGEGETARRVRRRVEHVTGIDPDEPSIDVARGYGDDITYVVGDVLSHPLEPGSFDLVTMVAALHHMDMAAGLTRLRDLVAPGGVLAVVGLARSRRPADLPYDAASAVALRVLRRGHVEWHTSAPILWPPPVTYPEARRIAEAVLPGVEYRRHLMWRYTLRWVNRSA